MLPHCLLGLSLAILFISSRHAYCDIELSNGSALARNRRYLVFPTPESLAPTKVQLIIGLGLPMEVDVSMIIGYVMKFNYVLPYNATYLTNPYVRYDRSIGRRDAEEDGNDASARDADVDGVGRVAVMSRWELYEIVESALETSRSGKACLLRAICEAAETPFNPGHGLCARLIHVFLTPSSSREPFRTSYDRVYRAAEIAGRRNPGQCRHLFSECSESILEYFTETF